MEIMRDSKKYSRRNNVNSVLMRSNTSGQNWVLKINLNNTQSTYDLKHYGVLGMHWGIRKDPKVYYKTGGLSKEAYVRSCDLWQKLDEFPGLTGKEKERVYEELDNNLSDFEKGLSIVKKHIDNYLYTAINKGHNQYKIIDRNRIEPPKTWDEWYDDIFTEVFGSDWRKYDY